MNIEKKLGASGVVQQTKQCNEIAITEFHTTNDKNELVYAITCDCVCL